ncbi:Uncharacterised protein [Klebsiella pneumoniae]|nr:Uncharacterised protein [Klebsiella pneumoniae]
MVDNHCLPPFIDRVTAVVHAATAILRQVATGGDDAGVIEQLPGNAQQHIAACQNARADAFGNQPVAGHRAAL